MDRIRGGAFFGVCPTHFKQQSTGASPSPLSPHSLSLSLSLWQDDSVGDSAADRRGLKRPLSGPPSPTERWQPPAPKRRRY